MFDLKALRLDLGMTQQEMAAAMGMPLRSYQDIEAGKNPVRPIHEVAARNVIAVKHVKDTLSREITTLEYLRSLPDDAIWEQTIEHPQRRIVTKETVEDQEERVAQLKKLLGDISNEKPAS